MSGCAVKSTLIRKTNATGTTRPGAACRVSVASALNKLPKRLRYCQMLWIETSSAAYTDGVQANKLSAAGSKGNISA